MSESNPIHALFTRLRIARSTMQKHFVCGIVAIVGIGLFIRPAAANKNFIPDWMFKGSSLSSFRTLGEADWRAENGEIVGTPRSAAYEI